MIGIVAMGWIVWGLILVGVGVFFSVPQRPDQLCGTPSFLSNGCWGSFLRIKQPGCEINHLPP
jgi:hypothetical protein